MEVKIDYKELMIMVMIKAHEGQFDKAGRPYYEHPLAVMKLLETKDEELQTIALGHDLLEDTVVTERKLRSLGFSERVIRGIVSLTKEDGESYEDYKEKVKENKDAVAVKIADLTHNMDIKRLVSVTDQDIKRQERYKSFYEELYKLKNSA